MSRNQLIRRIIQQLEQVLLLDECRGLAIAERTGREPEDCAEFTVGDDERAREILKLYPKEGR